MVTVKNVSTFILALEDAKEIQKRCLRDWYGYTHPHHFALPMHHSTCGIIRMHTNKHVDCHFHMVY